MFKLLNIFSRLAPVPVLAGVSALVWLGSAAAAEAPVGAPWSGVVQTMHEDQEHRTEQRLLS